MLKESTVRGGRTVEERLAREIVLVLNGTSGALRTKSELHKNAMINRYACSPSMQRSSRLIHPSYSGNIPAGRAAFQ